MLCCVTKKTLAWFLLFFYSCVIEKSKISWGWAVGTESLGLLSMLSIARPALPSLHLECIQILPFKWDMWLGDGPEKNEILEGKVFKHSDKIIDINRS